MLEDLESHMADWSGDYDSIWQAFHNSGTIYVNPRKVDEGWEWTRFCYSNSDHDIDQNQFWVSYYPVVILCDPESFKLALGIAKMSYDL
jgi:hypothetical protein